MAKIDVTVKFKNSTAGLLMVGIGGEILHFNNSKTLLVDLDPKTYVATIAGLLDPNADATVDVTIKQGGVEIGKRTITDKKFIKKQFVTVKP